MAKQRSKILEKFRRGEQFDWWRFLGSCAHLAAVVTVIIFASVNYPNALRSRNTGYSENAQRLRQLLMETLDYYVRYEHYYREVYGRYSRNLTSLGIPEELSQGTLSEIQQYYEISVLDVGPKRFLIFATPQPNLPSEINIRGDHITIDEHYRLNANFPLPPLAKKYLMLEADRVLRLRQHGLDVELGLAKEYWKFGNRMTGGRPKWLAYGIKPATMNGTTSIVVGADEDRGLASIFSQVKRRLNDNIKRRKPQSAEQGEGQEMQMAELHFLLSNARLAEHIYFREKGYYADDWESLDTIASFKLINRVLASNNVALEPIELTRDGFNLRVKGVRGTLLGELFTMNEAGEVKQIRYTDILVKELRRSSGFLQNPVGFQISEVPQDDSVISHEKNIKKPKQEPSLTD